MRSLRVIESGPGESIRNIAVDWTLLHLRGEDAIPDTLRFYTWRNRAVSVGYSQDISREIDIDRCRRFDVDVVFRPTGGALVLHQFDLTYSIVVGMPGLNPSMWSDFSRRVGCALCRGLRSLGLPSTCVGGGDVKGRRNRGACFSSLVRHEITVNGRKIIGNAKRWKRGALLQHGSIAVRHSALSIVDLMVGLNDCGRELKRSELDARSTTIETEMGRAMTYDDLWPILLDAFEKEFACAVEMDGLGEQEESRINEFVGLTRRGPGCRRPSRDARRRIIAAGGERR